MVEPDAAANGGESSRLQSMRLVAAVVELGSLGGPEKLPPSRIPPRRSAPISKWNAGDYCYRGGDFNTKDKTASAKASERHDFLRETHTELGSLGRTSTP